MNKHYIIKRIQIYNYIMESNNTCNLCGNNINNTDSQGSYCSICEEGFKVLEFLKNNDIDINETNITHYINSIMADEDALNSLYSKLDNDEVYLQLNYSQDKIDLIRDRLEILRSVFNHKE